MKYLYGITWCMEHVPYSPANLSVAYSGTPAQHSRTALLVRKSVSVSPTLVPQRNTTVQLCSYANVYQCRLFCRPSATRPYSFARMQKCVLGPACFQYNVLLNAYC